MAVPEYVKVPPITAYHLADDGAIPNSTFPLIVYHAAIAPAAADAETFERMFAENGWPPAWRWSIYPFHHYHSTAHEVLGVAAGSAEVMFGGPSGHAVQIAAGDAVLIPAGVGHRRIEASEDFLVVGAYPPGADWDLLKGEPGERPAADRNIAQVPLPQADPVFGPDGPLRDLWNVARSTA